MAGAETVLGAGLVDVRQLGARGDGQRVTDGNIVAGQTVLTSASGRFAAGDVGKRIRVWGAGTDGADLGTTIASFSNPQTVILAAPASTTVSGAVVDWGTDDTAALQAAFDTHHPFIPGGRYLVTANLVVWSDSVIRGVGPDAIIEWALGTVTTLGVIINEGRTHWVGNPPSGLPNNNITVRDLKIVGARGDGNSLGAVHMEKVTDLVIDSVCVEYASGAGINTDGSVRVRVVNCLVQNASPSDAGIDLKNASMVVAMGNTVEGGGDGIGHYGNVSTHYACTIQGNIIKNCRAHAILVGTTLAEGGLDQQHISVCGNNISNPGLTGVSIGDGSGYATIADNIINQPGSDGIDIRRGSTALTGPGHLVITGNVIEGAASRGINLNSRYSALSDIAIVGNVIRGANRHGILLNAEVNDIVNVTLAANHISNCGEYGILLYAYNGGDIEAVTISHNRCWDDQSVKTQDAGLRLLQGSGSTITKCIVQGNDFTGNIGSPVIAGTGHIIANNRGWVSENGGTAKVAHNGKISHGLSATPTQYQVTATVAGHMASVTAVSSSSLTIGLVDYLGRSVTKAENVVWRAWV